MRHAATHALLSRPRRDHRGLGLAASTASAPPRATTASRRARARAWSCGATRSCASWSTSSTSATTSTSTAAPSASAATSSRSSPPTRRDRDPRRVLRRRDRGHQRGRPGARQGAGHARSVRGLPGLALRHAAAAAAHGDRRRSRTSCASGSTSYDKQDASSRSSASSSARCTTSRCSSRWASATASRTTRATSRGAGRAIRRRRSSTTSPRTFCSFVDESHQTVPQVGGDVPRRSRPQGDAGRVRLPPAERARQPAAQVRGVRGARRDQVHLRLGHARRLRARARRSGVVVEQIIRPTGLLDPADQGAARRRPGRRSARRDPRARRKKTSASSSPR